MQNRKLLNIELGRISAREYKELPESGIVVVLDNVRSAHNVGSAFRTADSFKADKVWLCGICAVPPIFGVIIDFIGPWTLPVASLIILAIMVWGHWRVCKVTSEQQ